MHMEPQLGGRMWVGITVTHVSGRRCQRDEVRAVLCLDTDRRRSFRQRRSPRSRPETPAFSTTGGTATRPTASQTYRRISPCPT